MVDRYLNCTRIGCDGVAIANDVDLRRKNIKFRCNKCGKEFTISRQNYEFGVHAFGLADPSNFMRSGMK